MTDHDDTLLEDLFIAYYAARKNKRNKKSQLLFEMELESNMIELYHELRDRTYCPGASVCFIIDRPVKREVFASQFRDRVVQHLLFNYLEPIFERRFIHDSYSCRKGKGTSFGIDRLDRHIRSCTDNYKYRAWVLKLDIRGYFMGIDKRRLYGIVCRALEKHRVGYPGMEKGWAVDNGFVDYLLRQIIFNDPTQNVRMRSKPHEWDGLPDSKSLIKSPAGVGLPIGDLTSQLFSNVYLGVFDDFMKRELRVRYYGRYVDDFFLVHRSKCHLLEMLPQISEFLKSRLGLTLHPDKIYLQEYTKGVSFLGAVIKPHRRYAGRRAVKNFREAAGRIERTVRRGEMSAAARQCALSTLNSYLGYLGGFRSREIIRSRLKASPLSDVFTFIGSKNKLVVNNEAIT